MVLNPCRSTKNNSTANSIPLFSQHRRHVIIFVLCSQTRMTRRTGVANVGETRGAKNRTGKKTKTGSEKESMTQGG